MNAQCNLYVRKRENRNRLEPLPLLNNRPVLFRVSGVASDKKKTEATVEFSQNFHKKGEKIGKKSRKKLVSVGKNSGGNVNGGNASVSNVSVGNVSVGKVQRR